MLSVSCKSLTAPGPLFVRLSAAQQSGFAFPHSHGQRSAALRGGILYDDPTRVLSSSNLSPTERTVISCRWESISNLKAEGRLAFVGAVDRRRAETAQRRVRLHLAYSTCS
ncbi:hypothetical protein VZT92_012636 [Zoarces viviparus]|uniref:Uncharacterized protein n=1 Tax=Zoarces viviparus TaxID=48416 RepID=A0AAW1F1D0_ZOAVI